MGKLTKDEVKTICQRYVGGENGVALGKEYGVHSTTIYYQLRVNGIPRRKRMPPGPTRQPKATVDLICQMYKDGRSGADVGKEFNMCQANVYYYLEKNNIPRRKPMGPPGVSDEIKCLVCQKYKDGESGHQVAKEFGISTGYVYTILKLGGVPSRSLSEANRKYSLDQSVFSNITEESSYWIGFLLADGCLGLQGGGAVKIIQVALKHSDKGHLEKLRVFLGTDHPIYEHWGICNNKPYQSARLTINSKRIFDDLVYYGLKPRKSLDRNIKIKGLENDRHFWRGMVDGDGSIGIYKYGKYKYPSFGLCAGSQKLLRQFLDFLPFTMIKNVHPHKNIFRVEYAGSNAKKVISYLYSDCSIYLDRKMNIAQEVMAYGN